MGAAMRPQYTLDRQVVAFGAAAREDYFGGPGAEQGGYAVAGRFDGSACFASGTVQTRWIRKARHQVRLHGFYNRGLNWRGGGMVEVNGFSV